MEFSDYLENEEFVEKLLLEFGEPLDAQANTKQWSAKKDEIINMWRGFRPDMPIMISPMQEKEEGEGQSTYGEDGIRITGSFNFISSILSKLKGLIAYENPQTKLRLVLRGIDKKRGRADRNSYVFYLNLEKRKKGKAGRPKFPGAT